MVDNCKGTIFNIGPIKGSIFFRDCSNCTISVACSQFRCRDLSDSTIYLFAQNDPIIESSSNLKFAPYNLAYPKLDEHVAAVGFNPAANKWELIFDFTERDEGKNFNLLDPAEFKIRSIQVEEMEERPVTVFPFPKRYGGVIPDDAFTGGSAKKDEGGMESFGFSVTQ